MVVTLLSRIAVVAAATFALTGVSHAQVVTYYPNGAPWVAAVGGSGHYAVETFDDASALHPYIASIVGANVEIGVAPTSYFAGSPPVLRGIVDGLDTVTFNFTRPMIGFGANWDLFHPGGPGSQITLTLLGGETYTIENWLSNTDRGQFSGVVSAIPFTSFVLSEGTNPAGFQETFEMDNLKFATAVPEPETYAMLLAGLGLMGFVARRRQRALAA